MKTRNKSTPAVYLLLKKGGKVLLGRRQNTGYYDGWYGMPAGHIDAGELPVETVIREAREEVGINIDPKDIRFVHALYRTAHDETGDRSDYFFIAKTWRGEPKIMESEKCDDLQWFPANQLPENMIHHEKAALEAIEHGKKYLEIDKEHTHHNPSK